MKLWMACAIYVAALVVANLAVAAFGPWVSPVNALLFIGLDLTLRDRLHDAWAGEQLWPRMTVLIVVAGLVSYLLNPAAGSIAVASVVAFVSAGLADAGAYAWLRKSRWFGHYLARTNGSNAVGAAVDSLVFPTLAFGGLMPEIVVMQFLAKLVGGLAWSLVLARWSGSDEQDSGAASNERARAGSPATGA